MKVYELKAWQAINLNGEIYTFVKVDWMFGQWTNDKLDQTIIAFHANDDIDDFLCKVDSVTYSAIDTAHLPEYKTTGSAGWDLRSTHAYTIEPHTTIKVDTWLKVALPKWYVFIIKPRSSLAVNKWLLVIDWVIDSDYRGAVSVVVHNLWDTVVEIEENERIAQWVVIKHAKLPAAIDVEYEKFAENYPTTRGEWGFGSTWNF